MLAGADDPATPPSTRSGSSPAFPAPFWPSCPERPTWPTSSSRRRFRGI
ncbi:hypothetical protein ACFQX6_44875 [Streptosporangium lutulentum]